MSVSTVWRALSTVSIPLLGQSPDSTEAILAALLNGVRTVGVFVAVLLALAVGLELLATSAEHVLLNEPDEDDATGA